LQAKSGFGGADRSIFRYRTPKPQGDGHARSFLRRSPVSQVEETLGPIAESQFGVFSLEQARKAGVDPSTLDKRVERGALARVQPTVFAFPGTPPTWQREVTALALSVPGLAAASHKTAAFIWGMSSFQPDQAEIVTVRHRRVRRKHPQIHESKDLKPADVEVIDGIPVTTAVRTVVDVGASASQRYVEHCLDTGLRLDLFTLNDVRLFIKRVARSGRNGIGRVRPLVEERMRWNAASESALEDRFWRLIIDSALPAPAPQYRVYDGEIIVSRADFAYPERRILIELDGEHYHQDRATFQKDREKQNRLHTLGWTVYRFTWRQVIDTPEAVVAILTSALTRTSGVPQRNIVRCGTPKRSARV